MENFTTDPLISTHVLEESYGPSGEWFTLQQAAELEVLATGLWLRRQLADWPPLFYPWVKSGHRKHLRRAKPSQFQKLVNADLGQVVWGAHGRLLISPIHRRSETPKEFLKLQLSGFKPSEGPWDSSPAPLEIILNKSLGMSFGKAVIAASHATQLLTLEAISRRDEDFENWVRRGAPSTVRLDDPEDNSFEALRVAVQDHGLTEVPEGSVTASASLSL